MTRGPVATFLWKKSPAGQFELSLETLRILVDGLFPIFHPLTLRRLLVVRARIAILFYHGHFIVLATHHLHLIRQKFINWLSKSPAWPLKSGCRNAKYP